MYVRLRGTRDPGDEHQITLHDFIEIRAAQTRLENLAGYYEGTST